MSLGDSQMTKEESLIAHDIIHDLITPRAPATFKTMFTTDSSFEGVPISTYALGFAYTGDKIKDAKYRKILKHSAKALLDMHWHMLLMGLEMPVCSYDFDTLVIRSLEYKIKLTGEELYARLLILKDGKEVKLDEEER